MFEVKQFSPTPRGVARFQGGNIFDWDSANHPKGLARPLAPGLFRLVIPYEAAIVLVSLRLRSGRGFFFRTCAY